LLQPLHLFRAHSSHPLLSADYLLLSLLSRDFFFFWGLQPPPPLFRKYLGAGQHQKMLMFLPAFFYLWLYYRYVGLERVGSEESKMSKSENGNDETETKANGLFFQFFQGSDFIDSWSCFGSQPIK
jgi:hypothetical protein